MKGSETVCVFGKRIARCRFVRRVLSVNACVVAIMALALAVPCVRATDRTWVGSSSANWGTVNGFDGVPVSGDSLIFNAAGSSGNTLNNDISGLSINNVTVNGSGIFNLTGNAITLTGLYQVSGNYAETNSLAMSGAGRVVLSGGNTFTLLGVNTYSGATTNSNGTLVFAGSGGSTVSTVVIGLPNGNGNITALTVNETAAGSVTRGAGLVWNGSKFPASNNAHNFTVNGTSAGNTIEYFGPLTLAYGLLNGSVVANSAANVRLVFDSVTRNPGTAFDFARSATGFGGNTVSSQTANSANIVFTQAPTLSGNGGSGTSIGIVPWMEGRWTYDSTYGLRGLSASETATLTSGMSLGSGTAGQNANAANTITLSADTTVNSLAGSGTVNLGGKTLTLSSGYLQASVGLTIGSAANDGVLAMGQEGHLFVDNARTLVINSAISGSDGLTLSLNDYNGTSASCVFGGANTFTGVTTVLGNRWNDMSLKLTNSLALQNSTLDYNNYGASVVFGNGGISGQSAYTFGGLKGSMGLNLNNNNTTVGPVALTVGGNGDSTTYSGVLSSSTSGGSLIKAGSGTLTLAGANTYDGGTTLNGGILNAGIAQSGTASGPLGKSGTIAFGGGTLQFSSASGSWDPSPRFSAAAGQPVSIDVNGQNVAFASALSSGGGTLSVRNSSVSGKLTLSSVAHTYSGATVVNGATLALGSGGSIPNTTGITLTNGATLDVSAVTFTLGASQSLMGTGTVHGAMSAAGSSKIYAGADGGVSTLTFDNSLTLNSGAQVYLDVATAYNGANDRINVAGALQANGTVHIRASGGAANLDTTADYVLVSAASVSGSFATTPTWEGTAPANAANFQVQTAGNTVVLHYLADTPPIVTAASGTPSTLLRNQLTALSATVTVGSAPVTSVTVDASAIGGSAALALVSDGAGNYTNSLPVSAATGSGTKTLTVTASDGSLTGTRDITLAVNTSTEVWAGAAGDDNWSSSANWASGCAPGLTGDSLVFAGTSRLAPQMDASYGVGGLTFDATAGSFVIGTAGGALTLSGNITNNSANAQTVNVPLALSGARNVNAAAGDVTLGGSLSGTGVSISKTGAKTLTLTAANSYDGGTTVSEGTLAVSGSGTLGATTAPLVVSGGTLDLGGTAQSAGNVTLSGGTLQNGTLTGTNFLLQSGTEPASAVLAGAGATATKSTSSTVTLSGTNSYAGGTSVNEGTLKAGSNGAFGSGGVYVAGAGTLDINGQTIANALTDSTGAKIVNSAATQGVISGGYNSSAAANFVIGDFSVDGAGDILWSGAFNRTLFNGTFTKNGTGALTINGSAVFAGMGVVVNNGALIFGKTITSIPDLTVNGGVVKMDPNYQVSSANSWSGTIANSVTLNGGVWDLNGTGTNGVSNRMKHLYGTGGVITNSNPEPAMIQINARDTGPVATFSGNIVDGVGTVAVSFGYGGANNWTNLFTGTNTYSGATKVDDNKFVAGSTRAFSPNSALTLGAASTAQLDLNNYSNTVGSLAGGGANGGYVLTGSGAGGTLTCGGNNTDTTYAGKISGNGGLTKTGFGKMTLTGTNSYSGATTIRGGTLALGVGGAITNTPTFHLDSGATCDVSLVTFRLGGATNQTLEGIGTVKGTVVTTSSAALSPGTNGVGTLTLTQTPNLSSGGTFVANVNTNGTCGVLSVQGDLNVSAMALHVAATNQLVAAQTYVIAATTGGTVAGKFQSNNLPKNWIVRNEGTNLRLVWSLPGTIICVY